MRRVGYGFFSFTEITDPNEDVAYNEWHLYDHMPEQYKLTGIVWGQRWTRVAGSGSAVEPLDRVHYVTCYLMSEPIEPTLDEFQALAVELRAADRFHAARAAHVAGAFTVASTSTSHRTPIDPQVVPFRPHRFAHVRVDERAPGVAGAHEAVQEVLVPALLATDGVIGVWTYDHFSSARHPSIRDLHVTMTWTDGDPSAVEAASAAIALPGASVRISASLLPVTPDPSTWFSA